MRGNKNRSPLDLADVPAPPHKLEANKNSKKVKKSKNKSHFFLTFNLQGNKKSKSKVAIKIKPKIKGKEKPIKVVKVKEKIKHAKKKHEFLSFLKHKHKAKVVKVKEKPKVKEIKIKKIEKIKVKPIKLEKNKKHHKIDILSKLLLIKSMVFVSILLLFSITFSLFTKVSAPEGERFAPGQPRVLLFALSLIFLSIFVIVLIVQRHKSPKRTIDIKKMPKIDAPAPKKIDLIEEHFDVDKIDVSRELNKIKKEIDMLRKL